ncbi:hypothetical protein GGD66_004740 [Bradyrhizobium sp. CIR48]|uniref:hypothetical protein n=1 Tax=Bradyrhizobium sp. CIR48 TaxID=2663840 RepID=UPI001606C829|nr:hypothetical protein [Bradyrhizobium sp. CIR48]MBB4426179.1 hypothetical protein [Bradyrhizobium sp. CIR48]
MRRHRRLGAIPKLIQIKDEIGPHRHSTAMADLIVFRCPQTGMNVQTDLEKQLRQERRSFASFACPACTRLHFIDLASGQPMSRER